MSIWYKIIFHRNSSINPPRPRCRISWGTLIYYFYLRRTRCSQLGRNLSNSIWADFLRNQKLVWHQVLGFLSTGCLDNVWERWALILHTYSRFAPRLGVVRQNNNMYAPLISRKERFGNVAHHLLTPTKDQGTMTLGGQNIVLELLVCRFWCRFPGQCVRCTLISAWRKFRSKTRR